MNKPFEYTEMLYHKGPVEKVKGLPYDYVQINRFELAKDFLRLYDDKLCKPRFFTIPSALFKSEGVFFHTGDKWRKGRSFAVKNWTPEVNGVSLDHFKNIFKEELPIGDIREFFEILSLRFLWEIIFQSTPLEKEQYYWLHKRSMLILNRSYEWTQPHKAFVSLIKEGPIRREYHELIEFLQKRLPSSWPFAEILNYFIAGLGTLTSSLLWSSYLLSQQENQDQVDLEKLLIQAFKIYPPGFFIVRENLIPIEFQGIKIKKRSLINIPLIWIQRNEDAYAPFGLGKRKCLAAPYIPQFLVAILEVFRENYHLRCEVHPELLPELSLAPRFITPLVLTKKQSVS